MEGNVSTYHDRIVHKKVEGGDGKSFSARISVFCSIYMGRHCVQDAVLYPVRNFGSLLMATAAPELDTLHSERAKDLSVVY